MSRTLYYRENPIPKEEATSKNFRLMDALMAYFGTNGPYHLDQSHMDVIASWKAACKEMCLEDKVFEEIINNIHVTGGCILEVRY